MCIFKKVAYLATILLLAACSGKNSASPEAAKASDSLSLQAAKQATEVQLMSLQRVDFEHELLSNGKIRARNFADLRFRSEELIAEVWVKNGDKVRKGQPIASLDLFALKNTLAQRENNLAQAELAMTDILVAQGYDPKDRARIPAELLSLASIKSGYKQQQALYEEAEHRLQQATLRAPFDGLVANLEQRKQNLADLSKPFCRIIGREGMELDFQVMESELPLLHLGDRVLVLPFGNESAAKSGRLSEINPLVDEKGLVQVKAQVDAAAELYDGMNARVLVKRSLPNQFVVPKSAVLLRSGRRVLFSLQDGKAYWHYVDVLFENLRSYCVEGDELKEGMQVIVSGNEDLAHHSPVKPQAAEQ